jgi:hypothetical protein
MKNVMSEEGLKRRRILNVNIFSDTDNKFIISMQEDLDCDSLV